MNRWILCLVVDNVLMIMMNGNNQPSAIDMTLNRYFQPKIRKSGVRIIDTTTLHNCVDNNNDDDGIVIDADITAITTPIVASATSNQPCIDIVSDVDPNRQVEEERLSIEKNDAVNLTGISSSFSKVGSDGDDELQNDASDEHGQQKQITTGSPNRFAKWAYDSKDSNQRKLSDLTTEYQSPQKSFKKIPVVNRKNEIVVADQKVSKKRQRPVDTITTRSSTQISQCKKEFVPLKQLSESVQLEEINKWHTLAAMFTPPDDYDIPYTIQDRRYHMLLATLLHTRCQQPNVQGSIIKLVNYFQWRNGDRATITVPFVANHIVANDIVPHLTNLQYYNSKAKYIIQTSVYIRDHCNGTVPYTETELKRLPGIGPLFADLLAAINTVALHEQYRLRATTQPNYELK